MPAEAAFFDLDKTVIARASMIAFGKPFQRAGLLSRRVLVRALWGQLVYLWIGASEKKLVKTRDAALKLTRGWEQEKVRTIVREAIDEVIEPIVFEEALELIRQHQSEGRLVAIVSASPIEVVEPLSQHLGADIAIGTEAKIDEHGRYSGELVRYAYGPAKADAIRELAAARDIDLAASYAYSDSVTDLPMMELVGHPVAVNPDRPLLRVATEREWEVVRFVKPVRLRDRVPMPTATQTAAGGGVGALVAAAVIVWLRLRREPPSPPPGRLARLRRRAASLPRTRRGRGGG
ncbi:MAG TPA: HAD-IB family hydrolase [Acidimicrobiales bacterium]|nr:HAD-IB family hydrolase [Acidimicrobiales bacterium]